MIMSLGHHCTERSKRLNTHTTHCRFVPHKALKPRVLIHRAVIRQLCLRECQSEPFQTLKIRCRKIVLSRNEYKYIYKYIGIVQRSTTQDGNDQRTQICRKEMTYKFSSILTYKQYTDFVIFFFFNCKSLPCLVRLN